MRLQPLAPVRAIPAGLALKAALIHRDTTSHPVHLLQDAADPGRRARARFPAVLSISPIAGTTAAAPGTKNQARKSQLSRHPSGQEAF